VAIGCLVAHAAGAAPRASIDAPFEITADVIRYDDEQELYVAERHVRVVQADRSLKARWVAFSTATRIGVAEGDVDLVDGPDRLQADFMVFDIDSLQGMLFQGEFDSGSEGFRVRAREMIRTGRDTFRVRKGVFSTCRCEPGKRLPWQIRSSRADVEVGGYGTVRNSTFEVLGVPVLWIPWAFFPVKSERETGLLLPEFAFGGRGGPNFGLPFFWAAHPQVNLTLTPRYFTQRGYKQDAELEYVFGERSEGRLFVAGLRDRQEAPGDSYDENRWAVLWDHDHWLPGDLRWHTDLNLVSDNLYSDDFLEMNQFRAFRFIESTTNVARSFGSSGGYGAMIGARYADDAQGPTFRDRDEYILQRFAEARGDVQPGTLPRPLGLDLRVDSELVYFGWLRGPISERLTMEDPGTPLLTSFRRVDDGRFFDIGFDGRLIGGTTGGQGDGIYQPGEPLDEQGTRLLLHPRLARPFHLGRVVEVIPEVGWQQALYQSNRHDFSERGLLTGRLEMRGRLERDFAFGDGGRALRHVIEPRLGWALVSHRRQRSNPMFVPRGSIEQLRLRTLSLENVTRNPSDRTESANQIVFALGQRFFSRSHAGAVPRLRADVVTAIDWDFAESEGLGNLVLESRLFPIGPLSSRLRGVFDPESALVEAGEAELELQLPSPFAWLRHATLASRYRYLRRAPQFFESFRGETGQPRNGDAVLNQIDVTSRVELAARIRLSYSTVYSINAGKFLRNRGGVEYASKCRCWGIGVFVQQELRQGWGGGLELRFLGLGDDSTNLFDTGFGAGVNL